MLKWLGIDKLIRKLAQVKNDLRVRQMRKVGLKATQMIVRDAKGFAPVDTGTLRSLLTAEVTVRSKTVEGVVGGVHYTPYVEHGTRPHFPPVAALEGWASRHGVSAWAVAYAISKRGTKAQKFLERAVEKNRTRVLKLYKKTVWRILDK